MLKGGRSKGKSIVCTVTEYDPALFFLVNDSTFHL